MTSLRLIPLDDAVILPGMSVTLPLDPGADERVLLVPRQNNVFAKVGVVAEVTERMQLAGRGFAVSLTARHRAIPGAAHPHRDGQLRVDVDERPDTVPPKRLTDELEREYRATVEELLQLRGDDGRISAFVRSIAEPGALADTSGYAPDLSVAQKIELLETIDVVERLTLATRLQKERLAELQVRKRIREDVESGAAKQQREYFLHRQMDAIKKELGEGDGSVADEYRKKIAAAGMPEKVQQQAERELSRFERMGDQNAESSMIRTYLDWLLAVPWADPVRRTARPDVRARGARRRSCRTGRRETAHHRVPGGAQASGGPRSGGRSALGRDPHARRPSGHGQDVDRRVDRARDGAQVRPHVARRRAG